MLADKSLHTYNDWESCQAVADNMNEMSPNLTDGVIEARKVDGGGWQLHFNRDTRPMTLVDFVSYSTVYRRGAVTGGIGGAVITGLLCWLFLLPGHPARHAPASPQAASYTAVLR